MSRAQKARNLVFGLGALGGTVAVFATVLEHLYGDPDRKKFKNQLRAESHQANNPAFPKWDHNWDHRETIQDENNNSEGKTKLPTARRHIILIRHGQYNLEGKSDSERYLTELGREQARLTGLRLAELSLPYSFMIHSNMTRAIETSNIITSSLPKVPVLPADSILREGSPITPEPKVWSHRFDYQLSQDGARIEAAFRKYFHRADPNQEKDSYEIIVCHANVIRYFVCRALQFPPEAWLRLSLKHASLTWLVIRPDGEVYIRALGESGHFPPEMLSTS